MMGKTHMLGGICLAGSVVLVGQSIHPLPDLITLAAFFGGSVVGSLLPDIDEPDSKISRKMPVVSTLLSADRHRKSRAAKRWFMTEEERARAKTQLRDASHRGRTHYLLPWSIYLIISVIFALFEAKAHTGDMLWCMLLAFLVGINPGAFSHLLLDIISGKIPLFAPFYRKSIGICLFRTGGFLELIFVRLSLLLTDILIIIQIVS